MAAHWQNDSVSIFPVIVYHRAEDGADLVHKSYAFVSDDLDHTKPSIYDFNKLLLEDLFSCKELL